jgi:hypothetical protein
MLLRFFLRRLFERLYWAVLLHVWIDGPASRSEGTRATAAGASAGAFLLTFAEATATGTFTTPWSWAAAGTKLILKPVYLMLPASLLLVGEYCCDFLVHLFQGLGYFGACFGTNCIELLHVLVEDGFNLIGLFRCQVQVLP